MQTDWLIDFLTLAETRSFSRAAEMRHVTQPAFSRRIRSLEAWAMTTLVDRSRHPHTLTAAGELLRAKAPELVTAMQHTHALLRAHTSLDQPLIRLAAPHALALNFFPDWMQGLHGALNGTTLRLNTVDQVEAFKQLQQGECDWMLAYADADLPLEFDPERCEVLHLGQERLLPCVRPDASGQPRHRLPGTPRWPVPYLACAERTALGQVIEAALQRMPEPLHLLRVVETDTCESLMAMVLAGQGLAFLPERCVQTELVRNRLVVAGPPLPETLDICLVRLRTIAIGRTHPTPADALWKQLLARGSGRQERPLSSVADFRKRRSELVESA